jgi:hypothetical protein
MNDPMKWDTDGGVIQFATPEDATKAAELFRRIQDEARDAAVEEALKADRESALRDVFACSAMAALISRGETSGYVIREAYAFADAMMVARKVAP